MHYYSTNNKNLKYSFRDAILTGQAPDKGLFMPEKIPLLDLDFTKDLKQIDFHEIAYRVASNFIEDEIPENNLRDIIEDTLNFEIPLVKIHDRIYTLELFHGPTCAFKDVGARFLSRCMNYFQRKNDKTINVLVATSGDTGSAVANGFYKVEGINVIILYPSGKISKLQEQQITTLGENITALEIEATFDDCQQLVKDAFMDAKLNEQLVLTSANSINIARLIPQSFYYFHAFQQLDDPDQDITISVPSGNYGNLTAGLLAKRMGLPVKQFLVANNINDIVPQYLKTAIFEPRKSRKTLSNAMDVGNPSNFSRILDLYDHDYNAICEALKGYSYTDKQTIETIVKVNGQHGYLLDPHGATGYAALNEYLQKKNGSGIFLETAHPAKFLKDVQQYANLSCDLPEQLKSCLIKTKSSVKMKNKFSVFKDFLMVQG